MALFLGFATFFGWVTPLVAPPTLIGIVASPPLATPLPLGISILRVIRLFWWPPLLHGGVDWIFSQIHLVFAPLGNHSLYFTGFYVRPDPLKHRALHIYFFIFFKAYKYIFSSIFGYLPLSYIPLFHFKILEGLLIYYFLGHLTRPLLYQDTFFAGLVIYGKKIWTHVPS